MLVSDTFKIYQTTLKHLFKMYLIFIKWNLNISFSHV